MSEENVVQEPIENAGQAPVETPPAPPEPVEKVYEFQPTDEFDRPIGGLQRFVYKTDQELHEKLKKQNVELNRQLRKLNRDIRLGTPPMEENIPADAERFEDYKIAPVPLTAEERIQLVQDLNDPEKFDTAQARLVAANVGDPARILQTLNETRQLNEILLAEKEIQYFLQSTPQYYKCDENRQTICDWMVKNKLKPRKENFTLAYNTLKDAGLLLERPTEVPAVPVQVPAVDAPPVVQATPQEPRPATPAPRPTASGLNRSNSSDVGPAPKTGYSQKEIDKMSSEEYRIKVLLPEFKARQPQAGRA